MSRGLNSRFNKKLRASNGNKCAVITSECHSSGIMRVHHIKPRRNGGRVEGGKNVVCLCKRHHKVADAITLNNFRNFDIINEPTNKEDLVALIELIESSGMPTTFCAPKKKWPFAEIIHGMPYFMSSRKLFLWLKTEYAKLGMLS